MPEQNFMDVQLRDLHLLQVMLSDITEVWQLYFGLLFVGMVMFAPFGISGLMMMHAPLWRARVLWRLVRS